MTYTEEFIPSEEDQELVEAPPYPTVFGITFTPIIGGGIIAVMGLLGAAYLLMNMVLPTWQKNQDIQTKLQDTQTQIQQKQANQKKLNEAQEKLDAAKQQNKDVLALFANEKTLDTLLLDINRFIASRQGKLQSFVPAQQAAAVVSDGSLGAAVNGKLKIKNYAVQLDGSFDQIQSILRSIERLQTLLLVKDFQVQVDTSVEKPQKLVLDQQGKAVPIGQPMLKTSFKLQVLLPLTPDEEAAAAAAAAPPAKK